MSKIFDSHAHLSSFTDANLSVLLKNSNYYALNVTTKPSEWKDSLLLAKNNKTIYSAVGLHPWFVDDEWADELNNLNNIIESNKVSCLGEIGLDYFPDFVKNKINQLEALSAQLDLAEYYHLPLSLHCRKGFDDLFLNLKKRKLKGVLHGFSSSEKLAKQFIKLDIKIGIGRLILNRKSRKIIETVKKISIDDMVIESDCSKLGFESKILEVNELYLIIERIAFLKDIPISVVEETLYNNALIIFGRT